ncbi:MAG: sulfotransferase [Verrucomicrobiota bacterium]|nr:sulfotransferase [Verrucomicrobiota bacterium]
MRNVIILGAGRSGTSMVAGVLAGAGYFMGDRMIPADRHNPTGFFEDFEVNAINETLIECSIPGWCRWVPMRVPVLGGTLCQPAGHRWLVVLPVHRTIYEPDEALLDRMNALTAHAPFCFKDPRFSYTLQAWRRSLENVVHVCVFRDPETSAASMVRMCSSGPYWRAVRLNRSRALAVWEAMYRHILERHQPSGDWLFIHFNQLFDPVGMERLKAFTGAEVDRDFPDPDQIRDQPKSRLPEPLRSLYSRLCGLAGYDQSGMG